MHAFGYRQLSVLLALAFMLAAIVSCTQKETPQQLRQQTAHATAEAKSDAQAIAQGIREGWSRDKPLDVNTATKDDLLSLPGMTDAEADRVIAHRPYNDRDELVTRKIVPRSEYDKISDRITIRK
ncbi:MAG: helix-hairpin-helix domain-containing protein [Terriglobales bacterium]|jgi:DNA uptake protein ComE-like DNA-binding protein